MRSGLLHVLRERRNHRGLVLVRAAALQAILGRSFHEIEQELSLLTEAGKTKVLCPLPFLIVALKPRSWSGSRPARVLPEQHRSSGSALAHRGGPVSSRIAAAASNQGDRGAGEGGLLLAEVLAVLGPEADRSQFERILAGRPAALIHRCLRRVRATREIRVSRPALFRALLDRLST